MGGAAPSPDEVDDAVRRAEEEALHEPSMAMTGDYIDLLVKKGYLLKKRSAGQDKFRPSRKFAIAWADATTDAVTKIDARLLDEDFIGAVGLEMTKKVLGLDEQNIVKGRNPEEFVRLAGVIVSIARAYFGQEYVDQVKAMVNEETDRFRRSQDKRGAV